MLTHGWQKMRLTRASELLRLVFVSSRSYEEITLLKRSDLMTSIKGGQTFTEERNIRMFDLGARLNGIFTFDSTGRKV